jgi:signal transduction histidine kinase
MTQQWQLLKGLSRRVDLDIDEPVISPFDPVGLFERVLPFAIVAIVAEVSIVLPPGSQSTPALIVSLTLLIGVALSFWLPWNRIPQWLSVIVPVTYAGSLLALILATGQSNSGVGIVVLVPLVWTALFHRQWESACVTCTVVAIEIITALVPTQLATAIIARRVFFWTALGIVVSVAIQALRERQHRFHAEIVRLNEQIAKQAVLDDRGRIAREVNRSTMQRMISVGLHLAGTANVSQDAKVRERVLSAMNLLDETIGELRSAIFDATTKEPEATGAGHEGEGIPT